jgi:hypothetical protein
VEEELSVQSGCRWNGMECLVIELGSSPYPLYNQIAQVHDNLGVLVYGLRASESRMALQWCTMDRRGILESKKPGHRLSIMF